jgi:hypothetical protein
MKKNFLIEDNFINKNINKIINLPRMLPILWCDLGKISLKSLIVVDIKLKKNIKKYPYFKLNKQKKLDYSNLDQSKILIFSKVYI